MLRFTTAALFCGVLLMTGCDKEKGPQPDPAKQAELEAAKKEAKEAKDALEAIQKDVATSEELAAAREAAEAKKKELEAAVKPPAALALFQTELEKAGAQIKTLQVSLEAIGENAAGDLDTAYETFEKELEATKALAETLRQRKEDMTARGKAYFELWEKQLAAMKTESVKELAEKRQEELSENYGAVISATQLTGDAYDFYMKQITEIYEALDDDLSEETVKALAEKIKKAGEQAETIRGRVSTLVERLGKVAGIYATP
jgi:hypothetical protein